MPFLISKNTRDTDENGRKNIPTIGTENPDMKNRNIKIEKIKRCFAVDINIFLPSPDVTSGLPEGPID